MELLDQINQAATDFASSGKMEAAVTTAVERTLKSIINDELDTYSQFGKHLKVLVQNALKIHGDLDLPSYNDTILRVIATRVDAITTELIGKRVVEELTTLLTPAPEQIALSELLKKYLDHNARYERSTANQASFSIDWSESALFKNYGKVTIAPNSTRPKDNCIVMQFRTRDEMVDNCKVADIFDLQFGAQVNRRLFDGPYFGFDKYLLQMYAAGTTLVLDCDPEDVDLTYSDSE